MPPDPPYATAVADWLVRRDPAFAAVVRATGPFQPRPPAHDPFNALVRAILHQQLAGRAAAAIHARFLGLFGGGLPTADEALVMPLTSLRSAGLSGAKAAAIIDLARRSSDGSVPLDRLGELEDEEVVERLSSVRGVGRWTAEMYLLFDLRRPDVWPVGDLGVRRGWARLHGNGGPPAPRELTAAGEELRPHRSAAAWYCWRAVDAVTP